MGIEITSGGVSKTYRYYPYDAFYIDANGNVNTNGNGQQVKEAYFNGTKYYPEAFDGYQWVGNSSGVTVLGSRNYRASFSRQWNWYVSGDEYIIRYERQNGYPVTTQPSSGIWSGVLSYYRTFSWDDPHNDGPHLAVFEEQCTVTVDFGDFAWLREFMTDVGQAIFDAITSGLSVTGISREFDFIPLGLVPSGKKESDMDVNGLYVDGTGNIKLYCSSHAGESSSSGRYGYDAHYSCLEVCMPIDISKCEGSEIISTYTQNPYVWVNIALAAIHSVRFDSSGVSTSDSTRYPRPSQSYAKWESRTENFTYTQVKIS